MSYIEFSSAQNRLSMFLTHKLKGEYMNEKLCLRAQRLTDKWFEALKHPVMIPESDLQIVGCILNFGLGRIEVEKWRTKFARDHFGLEYLVPDAIALGYVNGYQLYIADVDQVPNLCARNTAANVERWNHTLKLTPPANSVLFVALERAKALGYLNHLKGLK